MGPTMIRIMIMTNVVRECGKGLRLFGVWLQGKRKYPFKLGLATVQGAVIDKA